MGLRFRVRNTLMRVTIRIATRADYFGFRGLTTLNPWAPKFQTSDLTPKVDSAAIETSRHTGGV